MDKKMFEDAEIQITKTTIGQARRYEALGSRSDQHYQLISSLLMDS